MACSLSACQKATLPQPLQKQQVVIEQRAAATGGHGLAARRSRALWQQQPVCAGVTAAALPPCSFGSRGPHRRQGPPCPAATTRQEQQQQQQEQEQQQVSISPSKDADGNFTSEALARLRYTSPDGRWLVRPLNKDDAAEVSGWCELSESCM